MAAGTKPGAGPVFLLIGIVVLVIITTTLAGWVRSASFTPAPVGTDLPPGATLLLIRGVEIFATATCATFLWLCVIRPWRREGELTWDGMLAIACLSMWIQDPMCNYFNFTFMYNAYFHNMGSWSSFIPGWQSPRGSNLPEPYLLTGGIYLWFCTLNVMAFTWLLARVRVWWPSVSTVALIPVAFLSLVGLDLMLQIPATRLGLFAYPGAVSGFTLWAGKPYQFPVYGDILINLVFVSIGLLRHFRDDRGLSLSEQGLEKLTLPAGLVKGARLVALIGYCNISYFVVYFLPYMWLAMQADSFPKYPSYMLSGVCGSGTPYACPSREVPVPGRDARAIVGPDDPRLSISARRN